MSYIPVIYSLAGRVIDYYYYFFFETVLLSIYFEFFID